MSERQSWFIDETAPPGLDFRRPETAERYDVKHGGFFLFDVVSSFSPREYAQEIEGWLISFSERTGVEYKADAETHVRDEYSTFDWILLGMIERAGFRVDHVRRDGACAMAITATKEGDRE